MVMADIRDVTGTSEEQELDEQHMESRARTPDPDQFGEDEFLMAPALEKLAETLIQKHDLDAQYFPITVLWKRKGGNSKGQPNVGKTQKLSGLTKFFADDAQFAIWLAADHVDGYAFTNFQLEAALFHELLHIKANVDDDGVTTPALRDHDVEGFTQDIMTYGEWRPQYRKMAKAFKQAYLIPEGFVS